jgi:hypothetical protein
MRWTAAAAAGRPPPTNSPSTTHLHKEGVCQPRVIQDLACRGWVGQARQLLFESRQADASWHTDSTPSERPGGARAHAWMRCNCKAGRRAGEAAPGSTCGTHQRGRGGTPGQCSPRTPRARRTGPAACSRGGGGGGGQAGASEAPAPTNTAPAACHHRA